MSYFKTLLSINYIDGYKDINKLRKNFLDEFKKITPNTIENEKKFNEGWFFILFHIGEILREHKHYNLSIKYFDESIKLKNNNLCAYLLRGLVYYNIKKFNKAKEDWLKVVEMNSEFKWLLELL